MFGDPTSFKRHLSNQHRPQKPPRIHGGEQKSDENEPDFDSVSSMSELCHNTRTHNLNRVAKLQHASGTLLVSESDDMSLAHRASELKNLLNQIDDLEIGLLQRKSKIDEAMTIVDRLHQDMTETQRTIEENLRSTETMRDSILQNLSVIAQECQSTRGCANWSFARFSSYVSISQPELYERLRNVFEKWSGLPGVVLRDLNGALIQMSGVPYPDQLELLRLLDFLRAEAVVNEGDEGEGTTGEGELEDSESSQSDSVSLSAEDGN